jgi:hypothetical protein
MQEPIEKVIERCRERINLSLDCSIGDILRICDELEKLRSQSMQPLPPWHGMGSGD